MRKRIDHKATDEEYELLATPVESGGATKLDDGMGDTQTNAVSNYRQGWGSYSASSNTTTAIALSAITGNNNIQTWFTAGALIK